MRYFFSLLMFLHGMIHLMGFTKGLNMANLEQIQADIPRLQGYFWLLAFLLFTFSGIDYLSGRCYWPYVAMAGVVISTILVLNIWSEARYGMIPNVMILTIALAGLSSCSMNRKIAQETQDILSLLPGDEQRIISEQDLYHLPEPVKQWMQTTGIVGKAEIKSARVEQVALMKMKPEQKEWYEAEAIQHTTMQTPAFIWSVRMNMSPLIKVRGRDKFVDGKGEMKIRINSLINVVNEKGEKMDEGTLQRYLGELVWYPSLALSPYITWEAIDDKTAIATMTYKGTTGSGTFHFNEQGDFVQYTAMRYMGNKPDAQRYLWVLTVDDYSVFEGIKVPSRMKATWKLDEGEWNWLKLNLVDINYNI